MDVPQETDDYIRESIDHSVGLPVSTGTLLGKLQSIEAANLLLRQQCLSLRSKIKEKDDAVERARAEASMNALALKKFVDENQKLAVECTNLLTQNNKWERECLLYDQDREAIMDFANEADEKAREAESHNQELVEQNKKLGEELLLYKLQSNSQSVDVSNDDMRMEQELLHSLMSSMLGKDDFRTNAHELLEANGGMEVCQKLLNMWSGLKPVTQMAIALVAEIKKLEKDKDHLTFNLSRAEEEVNVLFEENNILDEENRRLIRQRHREKHTSGSDGKYTTSASGKGKRKSSPKTGSPLEKKLDFSDSESQRLPLSPLQSNSDECSRTQKK